MSENETERRKILETSMQLGHIIKTNNFNKFDEYLKVLNDDYKKGYLLIKEIKKELSTVYTNEFMSAQSFSRLINPGYSLIFNKFLEF